MRITIVGLGLIGGSIARALRRPGRGGASWRITAVGRSGESLRRALAEGVVDAVAPDPATAVRDAELVVLAAPASANLLLLDEVAVALGPGSATTVSDVGGTKEAICRRAALHPGLRFVGGHPMSGRERSGYGAADGGLFEGRPWVVVPGPGAGDGDVTRVEALARACGARPVRLDAVVHDAAVAAVSHLPLVAAAALVEAAAGELDWPLSRSLAAQGWRDATRLAGGDPAMGAAILATNRAAVAARLRRYRAELERWLADLEEADEATLARRLEASRSALRGDG